MGIKNNEALEKALQQVLNSLAQAYLSLGKAYPEYDAASRSAFVQVVSKRSGARGLEPLSDGAVAFLTGLDVADVGRLKGAQDTDTPTSAATRLIELWLEEASDSEGHANPLPLQGEHSFASLLERTWPGQDPDDALSALVSIGLAELRGDMLYLDDAALPGPDDVEEASDLCSGAYPLLAAIGERSPERKPFVESRRYANVRGADVPRFKRIAESELREAHSRVGDLMSAYEALDDDALDEDGDERLSVTSGIYFVARERFSEA